MVGQSIGNYRIVDRLGEGGMATVYLATHPALGRRVAVKVLNAELAQIDQMVQRFFDEARAASAIGHRGIVEVFDLGTLPSGSPYIVMEYLEGESLAARLSRAGRLPLEAAVDIAGQAADVIEAAHARGIVHRDLKPDNLFLVPEPLWPDRELVKLLDFGIAKLIERPADARHQRTRTGVILGTPRYMSPEQCRESRDVDHRTDVYSLGVVLYEMLAGVPPFLSPSWGELAHMHIGVAPPPLQTQAIDVPAALADLVHRALEKDPGARFQSMAELARALRGAGAARTALLPGAAAAGPALEPGPPPVRGPGATLRLNEPSASAGTRPSRRTTLAGAASEIERQATPPAGAVRVASVLAGVAAVVAIAGALALRRTAPTAVPAPPPAVLAPAPPRPPAEPPARLVEPPAPAPPPPVVDKTPPPAPVKPRHRKPRAPAPAKPPVPPAPRLPEPEKI